MVVIIVFKGIRVNAEVSIKRASSSTHKISFTLSFVFIYFLIFGVEIEEKRMRIKYTGIWYKPPIRYRLRRRTRKSWEWSLPLGNKRRLKAERSQFRAKKDVSRSS